MNLARILIAVVAAWCGAVTASALQPQPTCNLKVENAPAVRGFRLGMTTAEVKARVPNLIIKDTGFGAAESYFSVSVFNGAPPEIFKGVNHLSMSFTDKRLVRLSVEYANQIKWRNADQFAEKVSAGLKLPKLWQADGDGATRLLTCDGFTVYVYPNRIIMNIPDATKVVQQRREDEEQKERERFEP